jgi:general secretion pathway protein E/type IV pilus assembly protein PilB
MGFTKMSEDSAPKDKSAESGAGGGLPVDLNIPADPALEAMMPSPDKPPEKTKQPLTLEEPAAKKPAPEKAAEEPPPNPNTAAPVSPQQGLPPGGDVKNKRIGDRLVEQGLIAPDQLKVALYEKQRSSKLLGEILVDLGFISSAVLSAFLAESTGLQQFDPKKTMLDPTAQDLITKKDALKYQMLPVTLDREKNKAVFAMADPYDVVAIDKLRQVLPRGCAITTLVCPPEVLADAIHKSYGVTTSIDGILKELAGDAASAKINLETLSEDEAYSHPIVRLVNALVFEAVKMGASDLHFEPEENFIRLRFRVDGDLITAHTLHKEYWGGISQRLKIMSEMNIADKLMPQDGRFNLNVGGREADFRVSSLPTVHGENIVLRVLDKSASIVPLNQLGFSEHNRKLIEKCLSRPEGIIIVTGPTGSGKTTTLYSMLNEVNTPDVNIQTLEDPVEYSLGLIRQTHVREGAGLTFAEGIKALLRQDPDIIFIGEVRDKMTAEQALKAAMTGHQVFTSLHTNDSFGSIPRLVDMGMQPGMLAGAIIAAFAQRLVRKLCPNCKVAKTATQEECKLLLYDQDGKPLDPDNPPTIYHPGGCPECNNVGYKGRIACVEILYMDEDMDNLIASGAHKSELKKLARAKGFKSMVDDGILKVYEGVTSLDSVIKTLNFADRM